MGSAPRSERKLRVGIDARCLNVDHLRGMGTYLSEVIRGLMEGHGIELRLFGDRPDLPFRIPDVPGVTGELFGLRGYRLHTWEQVGLPWRARRAALDVLHSTATTLPLWQPVPTVVTVHDTVPWDSGDEPGYGDRWYLSRLVPRAYERCAAVITISQSSRRDILRLWPGLEPKVRVIPHGINHRFFAATPGQPSPSLRELGVRQPYLVYVGGSIARKRPEWALSVFEATGAGDAQLVMVGIPEIAREEVSRLIPAGLRDRVVIAPFIDDADIPRLLQDAVAVLYPTLYEGFGLPVLEAHAVGTPVLFSAVSSLAELKGPAASVLPQADLDAWVRECRSLIQSRSACAQPIQAARAWAGQFSWEASASQHLEVYRSAASRAVP